MALLLACSACERAPAPAPLPPLPDEAGAALEAVLAHAHGPVRGTMGHVLLELRTSATGPVAETIALSEGRIRIDRDDGTTEIGAGGSAWRCRQGDAPVKLDDAETERLGRWRTLLGAVLLLPLHAPKTATWRGPEVIAIEASDGTTWRFELDVRTHRPRALAGPGGEVRFLEFLTTAVSDLPAQVTMGEDGPRWVRILATDVLFDDYVFQDPATRPASGQTRAAGITRVVNREARPLQPQVEVLNATLWLALDDPGDWEGRAAAIQGAGEDLAAQGQVGQGLPFTCDDAGNKRLGVPFEPDDQAGSRPFQATAGQNVQRRPRHLAAVVYRGKGDFGDALREAPAALAAFVRAHELTGDGPLRVVPYWAWEDGPPDAERLARIAVRFEQPLQDDAAARALATGGK